MKFLVTIFTFFMLSLPVYAQQIIPLIVHEKWAMIAMIYSPENHICSLQTENENGETLSFTFVKEFGIIASISSTKFSFTTQTHPDFYSRLKKLQLSFPSGYTLHPNYLIVGHDQISVMIGEDIAVYGSLMNRDTIIFTIDDTEISFDITSYRNYMEPFLTCIDYQFES
jgi:hypothetical protein